MERKDYIVTETAGHRVAGRRVTPGQTLSLTEPEARYELLNGTIVPAVKGASKTPSKKKD